MKRPPFGRIAFILPALACFIFFIIYPVYFNIFISFTNWQGYGRDFTFVGLANYINFFHNPELIFDIENAFFWSFFFLTVPVFFGLFLAALVGSDIKGKTIFRSIFYYPQVLSGLVAALLWSWMLAAYTGLIPDILGALNLGFLSNYIFVFNDQWSANGTIAVVALWGSVGFSMILFLTGIASINTSLIESARTDGAGTFAIYRKVIIPMLRPFLVIIVVFAIANALRFFDLVYAFTQGGPIGETQTFGLTMWIDAFVFNYYGQGAAVANILFVLTAIITVVYLRYYLKGEKGVWVK